MYIIIGNVGDKRGRTEIPLGPRAITLNGPSSYCGKWEVWGIGEFEAYKNECISHFWPNLSQIHVTCR